MYKLLLSVKPTKALAAARTNDLSEAIEPNINMAEALEATNRHACMSRAAFIRDNATVEMAKRYSINAGKTGISGIFMMRY